MFWSIVFIEKLIHITYQTSSSDAKRTQPSKTQLPDIYTSDMPPHKHTQLTAYADNITITVTHTDLHSTILT